MENWVVSVCFSLCYCFIYTICPVFFIYMWGNLLYGNTVPGLVKFNITRCLCSTLCIILVSHRAPERLMYSIWVTLQLKKLYLDIPSSVQFSSRLKARNIFCHLNSIKCQILNTISSLTGKCMTINGNVTQMFLVPK